MLGKVFKAYDVRSTYPDPLNESMAWQIGVGCAKFLLGEAEADGFTTPMMKNIAVGHDMRRSSPALKAALCQGIIDGGGHVIDLGLVDTPFVYFAVNHLDCAGGVQVTASHNPANYNGFKVSKRNAKPVGEATGLAEVRKVAALSDIRTRGDVTGHIDEKDLWSSYSEHVLQFCDLAGKELKVVVDASNGMAGTMIPKVFGERGEHVDGLTIVPLYFDNSTGEFAHEPNPLVEANLADLQTKVVAEQADFGICFDGDADRLVVVDELGEVVGCDHLTALLAKEFLNRHPGSSIIYDLRSSKALEEDVRSAGGTPVKGRVGHVFMKAAMAEHDAVFGGELSGHFYFRGNFNADSGAIALAETLTTLAHAGEPVSGLIKPIARYAQSGEINFENEDKDAAIEQLDETFSDRGDVDYLDGITIDCFDSEGWWCNVRKSNTEPLLRLNLEARTPDLVQRMVDQVAPLLGERVAH
jgi:phosphomannomutase